MSRIDDFKKLYYLGFEKVSVNTAAYQNPKLIREAVRVFGSQSIVGSMDVKYIHQHSTVMIRNGRLSTHQSSIEYAKYLESLGVGELLVNVINYDGMRCGYHYPLIEEISRIVNIPVIACGGANSLEDCKKAIDVGASAAAAGSMFVFWGRNQAVLINYQNLESGN